MLHLGGPIQRRFCLSATSATAIAVWRIPVSSTLGFVPVFDDVCPRYTGWKRDRRYNRFVCGNDLFADLVIGLCSPSSGAKMITMSRSFHVILSPQPNGGFFVECPALPGCYTEGDTREEALANIREAIILALEDLVDLGQAIPETSPPLIAEVSVDS